MPFVIFTRFPWNDKDKTYERYKNLTERLSAKLHAGWRPVQLGKGVGASRSIKLAKVDKVKPKNPAVKPKKAKTPGKPKKKKAKKSPVRQERH